MEGFVSAILTLLGLGQRSAGMTSAKKSEAIKLNTEFECILGKAAEFLRSEQVHLKHRLDEICGFETEHHETIEATINGLLSDVDIGLATAQNSRQTILNASSFATLSKWDELLSLLYQHKSSAELHLDKSQRCVDQFHRIIDNISMEIE